MQNEELKKQVYAYWNKQSCGTGVTQATKFSREYFDEIEAYRYFWEPEIFSFAQFTRFNGKKMLEVGIGAGSDFLQWVRAGAQAHGIDLTDEAIANVRNRLAIYGLQAAEIRVADAEKIPYPDNNFDLVYSWGVIHHTPDTMKALSEIIRVTKPGGSIKLMLYNRRSLSAYYFYLRHALLRGRPFRTIADVLYNHIESLGTKAYTVKEIRQIAAQHPVKVVSIQSPATNYDLLREYSKIFQIPAYLLACLCGFHRCGWFLMIELKKD
jgi:ubiquinone/menaquinone biosynthesis C-methylase UbiE